MQTLVINQGFMPLYKTSWANAIRLCAKGKAKIVQYYKEMIYDIQSNADTFFWGDDVIGESTWTGAMPKVIRLIGFSLPDNKGKVLPLSKGNLYNRDNGRCGYCLKDLSMKASTIDHIMPTSRGGKKHDWRNVVLSCRKCNEEKADRMPEEAGMKIRCRKPHAPPMNQRWIKGVKTTTLPSGAFAYSW